MVSTKCTKKYTLALECIMKKVTFILTLKERANLSNHAKALGMSRSTLIHKALRRYCKDHRLKIKNVLNQEKKAFSKLNKENNNE